MQPQNEQSNQIPYLTVQSMIVHDYFMTWNCNRDLPFINCLSNPVLVSIGCEQSLPQPLSFRDSSQSTCEESKGQRSAESRWFRPGIWYGVSGGIGFNINWWCYGSLPWQRVHYRLLRVYACHLKSGVTRKQQTTRYFTTSKIRIQLSRFKLEVYCYCNYLTKVLRSETLIEVLFPPFGWWNTQMFIITASYQYNPKTAYFCWCFKLQMN